MPMALVTEYINDDLVRHYSDQGFLIRQIETGDLYEDAVDLITTPITYEETDILPEDASIDADELLGILLGGEVE
jgi:DNA-binding GntR family transcriptional regulator